MSSSQFVRDDNSLNLLIPKEEVLLVELEESLGAKLMVPELVPADEAPVKEGEEEEEEEEESAMNARERKKRMALRGD
jgi:hypothetical protein